MWADYEKIFGIEAAFLLPDFIQVFDALSKFMNYLIGL